MLARDRLDWLALVVDGGRAHHVQVRELLAPDPCGPIEIGELGAVHQLVQVELARPLPRAALAQVDLVLAQEPVLRLRVQVARDDVRAGHGEQRLLELAPRFVVHLACEIRLRHVAREERQARRVVDHPELDLQHAPGHDHLHIQLLENARVVGDQHARPVAARRRRRLHDARRVLGRTAAAPLGHVLPAQPRAEIIGHVVSRAAVKMRLRQHQQVRVLGLHLLDDGLECVATLEAQCRASADIAAASLDVLSFERRGELSITLIRLRPCAARAPLDLPRPLSSAQPSISSRVDDAHAAGIPNEAKAPSLHLDDSARSRGRGRHDALSLHLGFTPQLSEQGVGVAERHLCLVRLRLPGHPAHTRLEPRQHRLLRSSARREHFSERVLGVHDDLGCAPEPAVEHSRRERAVEPQLLQLERQPARLSLQLRAKRRARAPDDLPERHGRVHRDAHVRLAEIRERVSDHLPWQDALEAQEGSRS